MNIIAMTTLAPAILETSLFQLCDELSNSWWHRMLLGVLGLASHALDGPTTSERIAYRRNPLQPSPCRLTPPLNCLYVPFRALIGISWGPWATRSSSMNQLDPTTAPAATETVNKRAAVHRLLCQLEQSNGPQSPNLARQSTHDKAPPIREHRHRCRQSQARCLSP